MSRVFGGSNGNNLNILQSLFTSNLFTFFVWFKETGNTGTTRRISRYDVNSSGDRISGELNSSDNVIHSVNQQFSANIATSGTMSASTWEPLIFSSDDSGPGGKLYIEALGEDLGPSGGQTGSFQSESSPKLTLGSTGTGFNPIQGKIAHFAIWDGVKLSAANRDSLVAGADPSTIDSGNLTAYWALTGTSLTDSINSYVLSITGTVTSDTGDNPPVGDADDAISVLRRRIEGY